ncbi:uncharacterized protein LOC144745072 [Ciona intestinalis]
MRYCQHIKAVYKTDELWYTTLLMPTVGYIYQKSISEMSAIKIFLCLVILGLLIELNTASQKNGQKRFKRSEDEEMMEMVGDDEFAPLPLKLERIKRGTKSRRRRVYRRRM